MSQNPPKHASGDSSAMPDVPASLDFDWYPIVFNEGISAGGSAHLTIRQDGSYNFHGHIHDSGSGSYNTAIAWVVKDSANNAYTFTHTGYITGTLVAGSRNDDWNVNGVNQLIRDHWSAIAAGWSWKASANVNFNVGALLKSITDTIGNGFLRVKVAHIVGVA